MFPVIPAGEEPASLPAFIVGSNGIFLRKHSVLGTSTARVDRVAHLPQVQPQIEYALPPVPAALSAQIAGFLLKVDQKKHGEGALLLCLDQDLKWQIIVPPQDNTGFDVKYFIEPDTIPKGWKLAGTIHSHPFGGGTPIPSFTDEKDEAKLDGLHLIAGSLNKEPKYAATVVVDGTRFKWLDWTQLIEPAEPVDVPDEWLTHIKDKSLVQKVTTYFGGSSWYGGSGSYYSALTPKEGETPEQALARYDKGSIKFLMDDAAKLGYKFEWRLTELTGDEQEITEPDKVSGPQTVVVGTTQAVEPEPVNSYQTDGAGPDWEEIEPVECEGKHPYRDCPTNCGCHCEPCKNGLVGAFLDKGKASKVCPCTECYNGCDAHIVGKGPLCINCQENLHYKDYSKPTLTGGY